MVVAYDEPKGCPFRYSFTVVSEKVATICSNSSEISSAASVAALTFIVRSCWLESRFHWRGWKGENAIVSKTDPHWPPEFDSIPKTPPPPTCRNTENEVTPKIACISVAEASGF